MIDSSPLALVEFGLDTRIRLWNPAAERIFGWSRAEMLGRGGLPMAPPSKRAESEELFERVKAGEPINDFETVRRRKDGTLVAVSIAAAPVRDASGAVLGNLVAYTDITERKAQEERLQALIDSSPLALVEFGLDTRIRLWNPAAERIFGWSRTEMLGRGGLPMAHPDRREESRGPVRAGARRRDDQRLRVGAPAQGRHARPRVDRRRAGEGRVRRDHQQHGRLHGHHRAQGAGGGGASPERRAPDPARRARRVARADRDRRRRRAAPPGAQPPRRRAAATRFARTVPAAGTGDARHGPRGRARDPRPGERRARTRARRAARAGPRPASGGADGSRSTGSRRDARRPGAVPGRDRGGPRRPPARGRRGGRLLPDRGGADQRREVRAGIRGARPHRRRERCERAGRGVRRRRRRRRPGRRVRPARPCGSRRGAGWLARGRQPGRRRDDIARHHSCSTRGTLRERHPTA